MEYALAIFVVIMFLIPCALIIFASEEAGYYQVSGEPVAEAARMNNITVVSSKDTQWNLPGATGGKTYVLSDHRGNNLTLTTQAFDSADSRDAAIRLYNSHPVGRGKPVTGLIVVGQHVIYASPSNSPMLQDLAPALKGKTVVQPQGQ
jgi:hypothetical protein